MTVTPLGISGELMASLCHWLTQLSVLGSSPAGQWILGFCPSWACSSLCRCSRHSANFTWPRDLAIPKGSLPRESGIEMARRSHLYSTTAASKCPRAHAHIWENRETERASSTQVKKKNTIWLLPLLPIEKLVLGSNLNSAIKHFRYKVAPIYVMYQQGWTQREPGISLCQPRRTVWGINEPISYQRSTGKVVHVQGVDLQFQVNAVCMLCAGTDSITNYCTENQC